MAKSSCRLTTPETKIPTSKGKQRFSRGVCYLSSFRLLNSQNLMSKPLLGQTRAELRSLVFYWDFFTSPNARGHLATNISLILAVHRRSDPRYFTPATEQPSYGPGDVKVLVATESGPMSEKVACNLFRLHRWFPLCWTAGSWWQAKPFWRESPFITWWENPMTERRNVCS